MRVAIVVPPYPLRENPSLPLGACYVAAAFEKAGAVVRIFDFVISRYSDEKLSRWVADFSPHVVGATCVTMNVHHAVRILSRAKEQSPTVITMIGGPHVSFDARQTLEQFPLIDVVVIGEGEATIAELVPRMFTPRRWHGIAGLAFRAAERVVVNEKREFIEDLATIPLPARHLLPISRYRALGFPVSIITSRGCPNRCIFCLGRRMVGSKVRYRDIDHVLEEIAYLLRIGFHTINIADDLFTANKDRVIRFCREVLANGLAFQWTAFSRVNTIDEEMVRMMKAAGCTCISFGIESGNSKMLKRIRKRITLDQARRAAAMCKEAGLMAHASFMVGLPGETQATLHDTERFARQLDMVYGYHFFAPFPGTTVAEQAEDYDITILTQDWRLYDANRPVVRTHGVSDEDATAFVARYLSEVEKHWARMEKGFDDGTNTPEENIRIAGRRSLDLVFDIIRDGWVEQLGELPANIDGDADAALVILCARVVRVAGRAPALTMRVLRNFSYGGNIVVRHCRSGCRWAWTSNEAIGA